MNLAIFCPSTGGHEAAIKTWEETLSTPREIVVNETITGKAAGYLQKVQKFYEETSADIIAHFHSDLFLHEPNWDLRVLDAFEDPDVVVASFFGAKQLGRPGLYEMPYDYRNLARGDCWSNMRDAELHGRRCRISMDVAMIDSFSLIVRKAFLDEIDGWPMHCPPSHGSDMWLCMMAARHKKRVRLVGVDCTHHSGGVRGDGRFNYPEWAAETEWGSDAAMHAWWHNYLFYEFQDVLPIRVA